MNAANDAKHIGALATRQQCLEYRTMGKTYAQIGSLVGIDASTAYRHVQEALRELAEERKSTADELRTLELERLDKLIRATEDILAKFHIVVNTKGVVEYGGDPLEDDGPALVAIGRLQSLSESRRKLLGLDAPTKLTDGDGNPPFKVIIGIDPDDA
jgi:hypothetical protein